MEGVLRSPYALPRTPVHYAGIPPRPPQLPPLSPHWDARCVAVDLQRTGDYIENVTRAHFRALIAQVNPALKPRIVKAGTRDAAVQATPRREASVQCSLGARTIAAPAALGTTQRSRHVADAGNNCSGTSAGSALLPQSSSSSKLNRVSGRLPRSRGLSLYSPVSFGWPRIPERIVETDGSHCIQSGIGSRALNPTFKHVPEKIVEVVETPVSEDVPEAPAAEKPACESSAPGEVPGAQEATGQAPCSLHTLGWTGSMSESRDAEAASASNWPLGEGGLRGLWDPSTAKEQRRAGDRGVRGAHGVAKRGVPRKGKIEATAEGCLEKESDVAVDERGSCPGQGVEVPGGAARSRGCPAQDVFVVRMMNTCGEPRSEIYAGALPTEAKQEREPPPLVDLCPGDYMNPPCMTLFTNDDDDDDDDSVMELLDEGASLETEVSTYVGVEPPLDMDPRGNAMKQSLASGRADDGSNDSPVEDAITEFGQFPDASL
uniref:Uncharacterized protein LOC116952827 n=1 Tax=Petromyzon marinus TaxID=7757 RepID=A0AAJ7U4C0_PETMA|nr:uncharacterized protein LOC116952827 [Petromyzon marinus]